MEDKNPDKPHQGRHDRRMRDARIAIGLLPYLFETPGEAIDELAAFATSCAVNPSFSSQPAGERARMGLVLWLDMASKGEAGFHPRTLLKERGGLVASNDRVDRFLFALHEAGAFTRRQ